MYLFYTHLLWQFAAAVAFIVCDSCSSPALTRGVTSLGGQQVEWLSHTGASRWHGTGAWASQHFVSNLPQPPTALWAGLPLHAFPTSLCLTPVSPRSRCAQLQAHKPRLFFTFLSPWPSCCVSFFFYLSRSPSECGVISLILISIFSQPGLFLRLRISSCWIKSEHWLHISQPIQPPRLIDKLRIDIPFKKKKKDGLSPA